MILMAFDQSGKIFNASSCGDNCARWIVKLGEKKDLTINLYHVMDFSEVTDFEALIEAYLQGRMKQAILDVIEGVCWEQGDCVDCTKKFHSPQNGSRSKIPGSHS